MERRTYAGREPDLVVLNLGAGRQSVALLAMACEGLIPKPDLVIHADTGHERKQTYAYMEQVVRPRCEAAGIPLLVVSNGNIREDTLRSVRSGTRIANAPYFVDKGNGKRGKLNRLCTSEYKIIPIERAIREHLGIGEGLRVHTKAHPYHVEQWIGIASEESRRAKGNRIPCRHKVSGGKVRTPKVGKCDEHPTGRPHPWSTLRYPLLELDLTTDDCVQIIEDLGWPVPVKSACVGCPFRSNASWARMKRDDPASFADAIDFDERLRWPDGRGVINKTAANVKGAKFPAFVHSSCKPLGEIEFVDDGEGESFGGEC